MYTTTVVTTGLHDEKSVDISEGLYANAIEALNAASNKLKTGENTAKVEVEVMLSDSRQARMDALNAEKKAIENFPSIHAELNRLLKEKLN
jgi:hypothetical protein